MLLGGALVPALCFFNVLNDAAALLLAFGGGAFAAIDPAQRAALLGPLQFVKVRSRPAGISTRASRH